MSGLSSKRRRRRYFAGGPPGFSGQRRRAEPLEESVSKRANRAYRAAVRPRSPEIEDLVNPRKRFEHGDAYDPIDPFEGAPGFEFRVAERNAGEVAVGPVDDVEDAVVAFAGDDRRLDRRYIRPVRPMQDLSRLQDIGASNNFSILNIRGGLPNFKLLDYLDRADDKFCVTSFMAHGGGVAPTDPGHYVLPFSAGEVNYIDPIASSCGFIRKFQRSGVSSASINGAKRIYYYALNAVVHSVDPSLWATTQTANPGVQFTFYGVPRPDYIPGWDLVARPELRFLPDPEHAFARGAFLTNTNVPITYPYTVAVTNWPYDDIYHRSSDCIIQSRIRISGVVQCAKYFTRTPISDGYLGTSIGVESSPWQERVRFLRPVVVVVLFLYKNTKGNRTGFDNVVDGYGFDAVTPQTSGDVWADALSQNWNPTMPRFYAEQDSNCRVLAYDVIDMSDTVPANAVRVSQINYQEASPVPPIVGGEQVAYEIYANDPMNYQIVDAPYAEKRFVFDVDLNNLVTRFSSKDWDYMTGSGSPDYLATEFGVDMIVDNSIHIAAYAYYPGFPLAYGYTTVETPPTSDSPYYRQPASIGYTSHLSFQDFKD